MPSSRKVKLYLTSHAILFWLRTGFPFPRLQALIILQNWPSPKNIPPSHKPYKNNGPFLFSTCQRTGTFPNHNPKKRKKRKKKTLPNFHLGWNPSKMWGVKIGIYPCFSWHKCMSGNLRVMSRKGTQQPQADFSGPLKERSDFGRFGKVYFFLGPKWMVYRYCWCFNDLFNVCWISTMVCITMLKRCEFYYISYRYILEGDNSEARIRDLCMIWQLPKATTSLQF